MSAIGIAILHRLQLLHDAQALHHQFIDFEAPDAGAADRQLTDCQRADGQRTHRDGRKSLVIGCHASHVVGMDRRESDALLSELMDWATQPRFVYRHEWTDGDMLVWDNTGVLHRAEPYPLESGRLMHRTTLLGEEEFA